MNRIQALQHLIVQNPTDAELRYLLGIEHASRGDFEQALACYRACLERDPDYAYAHFHAARAALELGRKDEARLGARRGLEAARKKHDARATAELEELIEEIG